MERRIPISTAIYLMVVVFFVMLVLLDRYAATSSGDNGQVESSKPLLRSNSVSSADPVPTRKRTSSGVFKVDDVSSPLKELENDKETKKETDTIETKNKEKIKKIEKNKKIDKTRKIEKNKKMDKNETNKKIEKKIELVEKLAKIKSAKNVKCVTAFKESDSWD